jgi:hypothetical protein
VKRILFLFLCLSFHRACADKGDGAGVERYASLLSNDYRAEQLLLTYCDATVDVRLAENLIAQPALLERLSAAQTPFPIKELHMTVPVSKHVFHRLLTALCNAPALIHLAINCHEKGIKQLNQVLEGLSTARNALQSLRLMADDFELPSSSMALLCSAQGCLNIQVLCKAKDLSALAASEAHVQRLKVNVMDKAHAEVDWKRLLGNSKLRTLQVDIACTQLVEALKQNVSLCTLGATSLPEHVSLRWVIAAIKLICFAWLPFVGSARLLLPCRDGGAPYAFRAHCEFTGDNRRVQCLAQASSFQCIETDVLGSHVKSRLHGSISPNSNSNAQGSADLNPHFAVNRMRSVFFAR